MVYKITGGYYTVNFLLLLWPVCLLVGEGLLWVHQVLSVNSPSAALAFPFATRGHLSFLLPIFSSFCYFSSLLALIF